MMWGFSQKNPKYCAVTSTDTSGEKRTMIKRVNQIIESHFETHVLGTVEFWLWKFRYVSFLAVLFCALASVALFIMGSMEILTPVFGIFLSIAGLTEGAHSEFGNEETLKAFIGALDLYLIAVFFLIFSFGLYELIISKIDVARNEVGVTEHQLLQITSLDELKSKIIKVIIIILMVAFFKNVISMKVIQMTDAVLLALAILALCIGSYYLTKDH